MSILNPSINSTLTPIILGRVDYAQTFAAMQEFTSQRGLQGTSGLTDQLWICEHNPVFTLGLSGKSEHIINAGNITVVQTNRGGQVTYHGHGQVVAYPLMDLKRTGYFVKEYVYRLEEAVVRTLMHFGITGHRVAGAPGVYVRMDDPKSHALLTQPSMPSAKSHFTGLGKIAALGIKVSRYGTYHGLALNVAMDLEPYSRINPCGYVGLHMVDLSTIGVFVSWADAAQVLSRKLCTHLAP